MSNFGGDGPDCHSGAPARDLSTYDKLPLRIRDKLKIARDNMCAGCVRLMLRRVGIEATAAWLDHERLFRQAWARRGDRLLEVLIREEELRP